MSVTCQESLSLKFCRSDEFTVVLESAETSGSGEQVHSDFVIKLEKEEGTWVAHLVKNTNLDSSSDYGLR